MKLIAALNANLRLSGEKLGDFAAQVKRLSDEDKRDFKRLFAEMGIDIEDVE